MSILQQNMEDMGFSSHPGIAAALQAYRAARTAHDSIMLAAKSAEQPGVVGSQVSRVHGALANNSQVGGWVGAGGWVG